MFLFSLSLAILTVSRSTQAEFEIPLVDTTNFADSDFQSVWGFYRSQQFNDNTTNLTENYEAWAVGKVINGQFPGFGSIYKWQGQQWQQVAPSPIDGDTGSLALLKPLTAVGGQYDYGAGNAELWFGALDTATNQASLLSTHGFNYTTSPATLDDSLTSPDATGLVVPMCNPTTLKCTGGNNAGLSCNPNNGGDCPALASCTGTPKKCSSGVFNGRSCLNDADCPVNQTAPLLNHPIYAIGGFQTFSGNLMAGGRDGLLMTHIGPPYTAQACVNISQISPFKGQCTTTPSIACTNNNPAAADYYTKVCPNTLLDRWQDISSVLTAPGLATANDDVTGISYVTPDTAYVTTTSFAGGIPSDRACAGTETGKLFRVVSTATSPNNWKLVAQKANTCFYGLSAVARDLPSRDNGAAASGPLQNFVWIASSGGIERVIDNDFNTTASLRTVTRVYTSSSKIYSVAAAANYGSDGVNLLLNGDFKSWTTLNPLTAIPNSCQSVAPPNSCNNGVNPDSWTIGYQNVFEKRGLSCTDGSQDIKLVSDAAPDLSGVVPDYAVQIEPGQAFNDGACTSPIDGITTAANATVVSARVPLTTVEGKRYQITGKYKVQFLTTLDGLATPRPANAFGGVQIACVGGARPWENVDCSIGTNKFLRANGNATNGFETFDVTLSRQDTQLLSPIKGVVPVPKNTGNGLAIEVRCMGTYGTRVTCDDISVVEVGNPPALPRDSVVVTGVGQSGLAVVNSDAMTYPTTFKVENNPATGLDLTGVTAIDATHVFAAGASSALIRRSAGSISGYIWAGTAVPGNVNVPAAAGWISTNCANDRDPATGKSFCQKSSTTYGLSLDSNAITGRAWFGKQYAAARTNDDQESINLGLCQNSGIKPGNRPYVITGSCNAATRTCLGDTTKVCFRDFDCYGRCQKDSGFICASNEDCQVGGTPTPPPTTLISTQLKTFPKNRVLCGVSDSSSLACTSTGWVTFNPAEFSDTLYGTNPPDASLGVLSGQRNYCAGALAAGRSGGVCLNPSDNHLQGLAQFMTLGNPNDPGSDPSQSWISFRGPAATAGAKFYGCKSCTTTAGRCQGGVNNGQLCAGPFNCPGGSCGTVLTCKYCQDESNHSCTPSATPPPVAAPSTFATNVCHLGCNGDPAKPCINDGQCNAGANETCRAVGYCSLKNAGALVQCGGNSDCQPALGSCISGAICNPSAGSCVQYGVNLDDTSGKFSGYAWNPIYGWLNMSSVQKGTARFIQSKLGDIYATGKIGSTDISPAPSNACNATYLITSHDTIVNFCSSLTTGVVSQPAEQSRATQIPFSSPSNVYQNVLGRFDLVGTETTAATKLIGPTTYEYNKYGSEIVRQDPVADGTEINFPFSGSSYLLGGKVLVAGQPGGTSNYTLSLANGNANFGNSCAVGTSGAGLLVVHGNLTISTNMYYISTCGSISDLRQLASLAIVVTGDLTIDNTVTNLVGTYYVQGTINTSSDLIGATNHYPLTVRGLMIGRQFIFGRKFAGTVENPLPSELFILDGRFQSNPMPGMVDFAGALPNTLNTGP